MAFVQRIISLTVTLGAKTGTSQPGKFNESGTNSVTITNSRMSVRVQNAGSLANNAATVKVWGLTPSLINQLATLGLTFNLVPNNTLTVQAGNLDSSGNPTNLAMVFSGTVRYAYANFEAQPDVPFIFECLGAGFGNVANATVTSIRGSSSAATIFQNIATQLGWGFENNGVTASIQNPRLAGPLVKQAQDLAEQIGCTIGLTYGGQNGSQPTLVIWPKGGNRNAGNAQVVTVSPATGMIGYPAFTQQGILVKTLFTPLIVQGGLISVQSSLLEGVAAALQQMGGSAPNSFPSQWAVNKVDLALDCLLPKGEWMTIAYAYNPGSANTILPPP